ncbi:hypothetical protein [Halolamina salifodinae]|uniref:Uncharacterized protein n=1 Tax=Halolamina salifodinae TaxID=1202767 RepID=A0A8T4GXJ8_9EURY|nr:hypothetical protein [Halolamina salifodinae]MBP1986025.1 hypothetical protein [Halolamina salifodinae]
MSEIRRISPDEGLPDEEVESVISGELKSLPSVESVEENPVRTEQGVIENYAFSGQRVFSGNFTHLSEHSISGEMTDYSGEYMLRGGSDLLLIAVESGSGKTLDLIRELNEHLPEDSRVRRGITSSTEDIWRFIQSAEHTGEVRVIKDGEKVDVSTLEEPLSEIKQRPLWDAELFFPKYGGDGEIFVVYDEENLELTVDNLSEAEYALQEFEQHIVD